MAAERTSNEVWASRPPDEKLSQHKTLLLRHYEPVLRFSAYERFFPMRVQDYWKECRLCEHIANKTDPTHRERGEIDLDAFTGDNNKSDCYMHYVAESPLERYIVIVMIAFAVAALILTAFGYRLGLPGIQQDSIRTHWKDIVRVTVLMATVAGWWYFRVNLDVYAAFVLLLAGLLCFGTDTILPRVGASVLAISLTGLLLITWTKDSKYRTAAIIVPLLAVPVITGVLDIHTQNSVFRKESFFIVIMVSSLLAAAMSFSRFAGVASVIFAKRILQKSFGGDTRVKYMSERVKRLKSSPRLILLVLYLVLWLVASGFQYQFKGNIFSTIKFANEDHFDHFWPLLACSLLGAVIVIWAEMFYRSWRYPAEALWSYLWSNRLFDLFTIGRIITLLINIVVWLAASVWANKLSDLVIVGLFLFHIISLLLLLGNSFLGAIQDLVSSQSNWTARQAGKQYAHTLATCIERRVPLFTYYGRVVDCDRWVVLQYHYFYAYNDSRLAAEGLNHHEGDWEMVAVYLEKDRDGQLCRQPFGVAYSAHTYADFRHWEDVVHVDAAALQREACARIQETVLDITGAQAAAQAITDALLNQVPGEMTAKQVRTTLKALAENGTIPDDMAEKLGGGSNALADAANLPGSHHPVVYVALGSHANYAFPDEHPIVLSEVEGTLSKVVHKLDTYMRDLKPDHSKYYYRPLVSHWPLYYVPAREQPGGLPVEFVGGDGVQIGCVREWLVNDPDQQTHPVSDFEELTKPEWLSDDTDQQPQPIHHDEEKHKTPKYFYYRDCTHIPLRTQLSRLDLPYVSQEYAYWDIEILDDNDLPYWVTFLGRWGRHAGMAEGGPHGPRNEGDLQKPEKLRKRWECPLAWRDDALWNLIMHKKENYTQQQKKKMLRTLAGEDVNDSQLLFTLSMLERM